jgi:tetratricopeptide (TPR) repeat protein
MMIRIRSVLSIIGGLLLSCCGTLSIKSSPSSAEVYIVVSGKDEAKRLGPTPFQSKISALSDYSNEGPITIQIKKDGYFTQSYFVPNLFTASLSIDANLTQNIPSSYVEINQVVSLAFQGERYVLQKRYDDATKIADDIRKINPNIAVAYHLMGTVHYLQNRLKDSRFAWQRAIELEPNDIEAKNMLAIVEKKMADPARPRQGN